MSEFAIEIESDPTPDDLGVVERGLIDHGEARSEPRSAQPSRLRHSRGLSRRSHEVLHGEA